jgi:hypothetical protein
MRSMMRILPVVVLAALAAACGKGPAEQALKAADAAMETARPQVEKFVPAEWKSLSDAAAAAKTQFEQGNYKEALAGAQALVPKVQAAVAAAEAKKKELAATFDALKASLPTALDALGKQLTAYAAMRKLPAGIDKAAVAAAQAELPNVSQAWTDAAAAFDGGDVMKAVEGGLSVKSKLDELTKTFMPTATAAAAK